MKTKPSSRVSRSEYDKQIALVLRVAERSARIRPAYEAMAEYGYQPDWVAGISIGRIECRMRSAQV